MECHQQNAGWKVIKIEIKIFKEIFGGWGKV
jgi:hypothetical protein